MDIDSDMVGGELIKMDEITPNKEPITSFNGQYRWLSNFYPCPVVLDGQAYRSVEHAFQAAKSLDEWDRRAIRETPKPGEAKMLGRCVKIREGWEGIKEGIMLNLLRQKFGVGELKEWLLETGDARLIEGNHWGDIYWGVCRGMGKNRLGELLMQVRDEIKRG